VAGAHSCYEHGARAHSPSVLLLAAHGVRRTTASPSAASACGRPSWGRRAWWRTARWGAQVRPPIVAMHAVHCLRFC